MSCSTAGCPNAAGKLKCPECTKLGLPDAYFCSQECFRANWGKHKLVHLKPEDVLPVHFYGFQFTGKLKPGTVSPRRPLPDHIPRPDYAESSIPYSENRIKRSNVIEIMSDASIEKMRRICRIGREVLDTAAQAVEPGVTTDYIDEVVHNACIERGVYPSPLNYCGFPKSVCTSVNEIICHGIPDSRKLVDGDIINIDISTYLDGFHADLNATYPVGNVSDHASHLLKVARECLDRAIALVKPGEMYKNLGQAIDSHATANGFQVVRRYCGHGVHKYFHCPPNIPHYFPNKTPGVMRPGHIFTIEPMINAGTWRDVTWPDNWTSATEDGKLSAQFEETLLVTNDGVEILTGAIPPASSPSS